ncbi:MAG: hypothetical protein QMA93_02115, partial [Acidimicrobiales bacterium]
SDSSPGAPVAAWLPPSLSTGYNAGVWVEICCYRLSTRHDVCKEPTVQQLATMKSAPATIVATSRNKFRLL